MSTAQTHLAALLPKSGASVSHSIESRSTPSPSSSELLIKITATAINPVDWKVRDLGFFHSKWPAILGSDAAGTVAAVGSDVQGSFEVGERVFFQGIIGRYESCTFQQYCVMPASLVGKTPKGTSDEEAAGVSLATLAVVTGFYDGTGQGLSPPWARGGEAVGKGKAAVVLGGSSSVGQYAVQFARLSGFERVVTNSSQKHFEHLKGLGATQVLDRSKADAEEFGKAVGGLDVGFVYDAISEKETQSMGVKILHSLGKKGNVICVQGVNDGAKAEGEKVGVEVKQIMGLGSKPELRPLSEPLMKALGGEDGWIAKGQFVPNRVDVVNGGLRGLDDALEKNKKGVSGVKVVIKPQESA